MNKFNLVYSVIVFLFTTAVTTFGSDAAVKFKETLALAEQGNAQAQCNLALMYENGRGVTKDYAKAVEWYTKAAEQGYAEAKNNLSILKNRPRITPEIIEGFWTNVLESATRITFAPRLEGADTQASEGRLIAFGLRYMPNAYEYYREVRAKAIEREQVFKRDFPFEISLDSSSDKRYQEVKKETTKAVAEYFRRHDELCYFYLMHKAGIMNSEELKKLDETKISIILCETEELVDIKLASESVDDRTFVKEHMPLTLTAFDRLTKMLIDSILLDRELILDTITLDSVKSMNVLNIIHSRINLIEENRNKLILTFNQNRRLHSANELTVEELLKQDEKLSAEMQNLEKRLLIQEYSKEWFASNWTDTEMWNVVIKCAPIFGLQFTMVPIPNKDYFVCKYEVTQGLWQAVMGNNPSAIKGDLNRPVENVSWDDCQKFIEKLNSLPEIKGSGLVYRLPTSEEWEYAYRAGATGDYFKLADGTEITKETLVNVAWCDENSDGKTYPVGQKKPNAFGLYDMYGNVWEWTSTRDIDNCVFCGGSWYYSAGYWRPSSRISSHPGHRYTDKGVRLSASRRADKAQKEK